MGQGERIEIVTHCPLTPSSKRSLRLQGIKKRLNLHFRPNPILVTVSLALILMVSGIVILWMLIPDIGVFEDLGETFPSKGHMLYVFTSFMWFLITSLAGLMVIAGKMDKRVSTME
jgi:hypothetical protein